ncbi:MAG: GDSL-type esterase/lipase family protein [Zavarzinella sp.]
MKNSLRMWCVFAVVAGTCVVPASTWAQSKATVTPRERKDKFAADRHQKFVKIAQAGGVDVLFLGDSITQGWEGNGKEQWAKHFAPLKAANFGIGGDRTEDIIWRITEGKELEGITPKVCVLMIGTNNSGANTPEDIAAGVTKIVELLRSKKPEMKVLLLGVFPRSGVNAKTLKMADRVAADELNKKIPAINEIIKKLDDGKMVKYLDINKKFLNADGALLKSVMPDFLHLSKDGYAIWAEAIVSEVNAMLK